MQIISAGINATLFAMTLCVLTFPAGLQEVVSLSPLLDKLHSLWGVCGGGVCVLGSEITNVIKNFPHKFIPALGGIYARTLAERCDIS